MDGNSWTVFSYFPRAGIIQPKFIAAAQLRKILSKNAVTTPGTTLASLSLSPSSLLCHFVKSAESSRIADRQLLIERVPIAYYRSRTHENASRLIAVNYRSCNNTSPRGDHSKDVAKRDA